MAFDMDKMDKMECVCVTHPLVCHYAKKEALQLTESTQTKRNEDGKEERIQGKNTLRITMDITQRLLCLLDAKFRQRVQHQRKPKMD